MKKIQLLVIALVASTSMFAQAQNWTLDKSHAKLGFTVTHLMISDVEGFFKSFDIKLTANQADFSDAQIELTAEINSIWTDNDQRDGHLKGSDFFDAEKFKTLNFKSTSFTKSGEKTYTLKGDLTMHGITKPVTLEVILKGTAVHPYNKKTIAGFKVTGMLKRSDFEVGKNMPTAVVSDEVTIVANAEFSKD